MDKRSGVAAVALAALLGGCSVAPPYQPPLAVAPPTFREAGPWVSAQPRSVSAADGWWRVYGDDVLDTLETRLATANPSLDAAVARYKAAQALLRQARSDQLPTIDAAAGTELQRQSDNAPLRGSFPPVYSTHTIGLQASYEPDLWGRIGNDVASHRADMQASADDVAALRLSLQRQLASAYFELRGSDAQGDLLRRSVKAFADADTLTRNRFRGGIASALDTGRSGTMLASAQAELIETTRKRALTEHVIATLIGETASTFALPVSSGLPANPPLPPLVPSTLLERRPDVAAAERRMAAANADIGVARAAFFPSVSLGGGGGFESKALGTLLTAPSTIWSIGGSVLANLFDGGKRRGQVAAARAHWDETTSIYRETVLTAFQEVEDDLANVHHLGDETAAQMRAAQQAGVTERVALDRYVKGAATYLDVVSAQTAALDARRATIGLRVRTLQSDAALVTALGGGWTGQPLQESPTQHRTEKAS